MRSDCAAFLIVVAVVFVSTVRMKMGSVTPRYGQRAAANAAKRGEADKAISSSATFTAVTSRASELAVALEQATRLGGVDLIGTYTEAGAATALYSGYLERLASLDKGARLRLKVESVGLTGDPRPEPVVATVAYLVSGGEAQDDGRLLAREHWYWAMVRSRCDTCGAPQVGASNECLYCGADLAGPTRWVVSRVETSEAVRSVSAPLG